ncbi:MAG: sulfatase [Gemmatimonadaceae bacterium]
MPVSAGRGAGSAHINSAVWIVLAAAVAGLTSAALQIALLTARLTWERTLIWHPRGFVWMVPAAYLVLFVGTAVPVAGAALLFGRIIRPSTLRSWAARFFVFLGALAVLLLSQRLAQWSQLLLAAGVGVSVGTILARQSTRHLGTIAFALTLVLAAIGGGGALWRMAGASRAMSSLPAAPAGAPNVLLIILDTVRAASLSLYGYQQPTSPALTRWAAEGVTFDHAMSTSSWTLPSHGSMFTGLAAAELSTSWRTPLDDEVPTLAEVLRGRGYATAGFVANTYYAGHDSGLDRGFVRYDDYRTSLWQLVWSTTLAQTNLTASLRGSRSWRDVAGALRWFDLSAPTLRIADRKPATMVTDQFLAWQGASSNRPFFAFLNYFDAHERSYAPDRYRRRFGADTGKQDRYDESIRYLDDEIDRLLSTLRDRGVLDRTLVVVTSDHGEQFGEHNRWGHGNTLYLPVLRVPLVVRYPPRVPSGLRVEGAVSLRDLPSTILKLANIDGAALPGTSLTIAWDSSRAVHATAPVESYLTSFEDAWLPRARQRTMRSVFVDHLHWIRAFDGREELYAYRTDPGERVNLIADPSAVARLDSARARYGLSR